MPTLYIIAGPKGAGRTTASKSLLPNVFATDIFINADLIEAQLNPQNVEAVAMKAARMMLEQIQTILQERKTFAFETTMASRSYLNLVKQAQLLGYDMVLICKLFSNSIFHLVRRRIIFFYSATYHYIFNNIRLLRIKTKYFKQKRNAF